MLESIAIIIHVIIVIVRIAEKAVAFGENERRIDRGHGKACFFRIAEGQYFLGFIVEIAAVFVPQVGGGLLVAYDLIGRFYADAAVIGSQNEVDLLIGDLFERLVQRRMFEPSLAVRLR